MAVSTYLSVTTLKVSGLNVPIKRHKGLWNELNQKTTLSSMLLMRDSLQSSRDTDLKYKKIEKYIPCK